MLPKSSLPLKRGVCFEGRDSSVLHIPAQTLIQGELPRYPEQQAGRLAKQFVQQNRGILSDFGVTSRVAYDGETVDLVHCLQVKLFCELSSQKLATIHE